MELSKKVLFTILILIMLLGYFFALLQIFKTSGFDIAGVIAHFQGNEDEMMSAMSMEQLISISHIHMFSMPLVLTPSAFLFVSYVRWNEFKKVIVLLIGYVGIVLDVLAWWGIVYLGKFFLIPLFLGGAFFGFGILIMSIASLWSIWQQDVIN